MINDIHQKNSIDLFISINQERYFLYARLREQFNQITEESYIEILKLIENNKKYIFQTHYDAYYFVLIIFQSARCNFKQQELILDVFIHFSHDVSEANVTENEIIKLCSLSINIINYLFSKGVITVSSIIKEVIKNKLLFINFYHEIVEFDFEYSHIIEKVIFKNNDDSYYDECLKNYFSFVKNNKEQHIKYRNANYHPSLLHKSIREDDIDAFQSILTKNNYGINYKIEYSFYERSLPKDQEISLIQTAAIYGSLKIFKFLWMQENIFLNENLQIYAYFGNNYEIIHICESKCSSEGILFETIASYRNDLFDYAIEKIEKQKEKEEILDVLNDYIEDDNSFKKLSYQNLNSSIYLSNVRIILENIRKIAFIVQNYEFSNNYNDDYANSFLSNSLSDFELFKFLFSLKSDEFASSKFINLLNSLIEYSIEDGAVDSFRYLFDKYMNIIDIKKALKTSIQSSPFCACLILDLQFIYNEFDIIDLNTIFYSLKFYNEDIIVKLIKNSYDKIKGNESLFISNLCICLSSKMIQSLFNRIFDFLPIEDFNCLQNLLQENGHSLVCKQ